MLHDDALKAATAAAKDTRAPQVVAYDHSLGLPGWGCFTTYPATQSREGDTLLYRVDPPQVPAPKPAPADPMDQVLPGGTLCNRRNDARKAPAPAPSALTVPKLPAKGCPVRSDDPRKPAIVAALKKAANCSKVTEVHQVGEVNFTGHCHTYAGNRGRSVQYLDLGTFQVYMPELRGKQ